VGRCVTDAAQYGNGHGDFYSDKYTDSYGYRHAGCHVDQYGNIDTDEHSNVYPD
jgi:hypothetical protein